jgi:hypothetical protein
MFHERYGWKRVSGLLVLGLIDFANKLLFLDRMIRVVSLQLLIVLADLARG